MPRLRRAKREELHDLLPADTRRVSPEERAASLARRRLAVLRRYRR